MELAIRIAIMQRVAMEVLCAATSGGSCGLFHTGSPLWFRMKRAVERWLHKAAARAFASWLQHAQTARRTRSLLKRAAVKWLRRFVSSAFAAWLAFTGACAIRKVLLRKTAARWTLRSQASAFACWLEGTQTARRQRTLLHRCMARMRERAMVIVFDAWVAVIRCSARLSAVLLKAQAHDIQRAIKLALTRWRSFRRDQLVQKWVERHAQRVQRAAEKTIDEIVRLAKEREVVLQEREAVGFRRENQLQVRVLSLENELLHAQQKANEHTQNSDVWARRLGFFELEIARLTDLVHIGESRERTLQSLVVTLEKEKLDLMKEVEDSRERTMSCVAGLRGPASWVNSNTASPFQKPTDMF